MIEVEQLRKVYDGKAALDGFSLNVAPGELFGLVGPNGAGKTTLIKILSTFLPATSGIARVAGMDVRRDRDEVKQVVGYMPDQPGLYQEMRILEYLQFFADAFHIPKATQAVRIHEALFRAGLSERKQTFVEELSFGLKQRLLLAKTLLHQPKVLLLDEPATGLDPIARLDLRKQLKQLNAEGVTILISSHILNDLEDICSRVALISGGKNIADSNGQQVIQLTQPNDAKRVYEMEFLGSPESAVQAAKSIANVRVVQVDGSRLLLELPTEHDEVAAILSRLIASGVKVFKFSQRSGSLEESYKQVFGAKHL
jgi:ABC-2 type transport system ATP-binding protein